MCTDCCFFTWSRNGSEVVFQQTDPAGARSESERHPRRGLQIFSAANGRPTRLIPVRGDAAGPYAWSPDGRSVVVQGQQQPELAETKTGRVVRDFPAADVYWGADGRLLWLDRERGQAVLMDQTGRVVERRELPSELTANLILLLTPR